MNPTAHATTRSLKRRAGHAWRRAAGATMRTRLAAVTVGA
jgi:hypothetical protein